MYRALAPAAAVSALLVFAAGCGGDSGAAAGSSTPVTVSPPAPATTLATPTEAETTDPACDDEPCYGAIEHLGTLTHDVVEQVSGMAASHRHPELYYAVSDVPGTSEVAVIEEDGTLVAHIEIDGMSARDAEALAVGPCGSPAEASCLFIGDIGNHVGLDDLFVYRVVEPDLDEPPASVPAERIRYTYPDAPTDAEALLVDDDGRPLMISKARFDSEAGTTGATRLYRGDVDGGVLEFISEIELPEPVNPMFALVVGHVVTGADATDGRVLLRTYDEVYEYRADARDADLSNFPDWPVARVPAPLQVQSETIAYRLTGCGYLTTSELTGSIDAVNCR